MENAKKQITLSASQTITVMQDKANIVLRIIVNEKTRVEAQKKLKEKTQEVLKMLAARKELKPNVSQARVYEKNVMKNDKVSRDGYEGQGLINIISYDFDALNIAIEELEERVELHSVTTSVSSKTLKKEEQKLTKEAIEEFKSRAQLIADGFGFKSYQLEDIEVSNTQSENYHGHRFGSQSAYMASAASLRVSAESAESNPDMISPVEEKLTVTIGGKVVLVNKFLD